MAKDKWRVFLDTSAILAGLNSPHGAAGAVLGLCFSRDVDALISKQVIDEADRNIAKKFPKLLDGWRSFLLLPPTLIGDPSEREIQRAFRLLPTSDAPILAAAIKARPNFLITWNTRDFLRRAVVEKTPFVICTPGEFLENYRRTFAL